MYVTRDNGEKAYIHDQGFPCEMDESDFQMRLASCKTSWVLFETCEWVAFDVEGSDIWGKWIGWWQLKKRSIIVWEMRRKWHEPRNAAKLNDSEVWMLKSSATIMIRISGMMMVIGIGSLCFRFLYLRLPALLMATSLTALSFAYLSFE